LHCFCEAMDLLLSQFTASAEFSLKSCNAPESALDIIFFNGFWVFICCRKNGIADIGACVWRRNQLFIRRIMNLTLVHCTDRVGSLVIPLLCTNNSFKFYRLPIIMSLPVEFSENGIYAHSVRKKRCALSCCHCLAVVCCIKYMMRQGTRIRNRKMFHTVKLMPCVEVPPFHDCS